MHTQIHTYTHIYTLYIKALLLTQNIYFDVWRLRTITKRIIVRLRIAISVGTHTCMMHMHDDGNQRRTHA